MNAKTKTLQNQVRASALMGAVLMASAIFSGVLSLADQPAATIIVAQAAGPVQR